eukprot:1220209-Amphidinium_carterae.1
MSKVGFLLRQADNIAEEAQRATYVSAANVPSAPPPFTSDNQQSHALNSGRVRAVRGGCDTWLLSEAVDDVLGDSKLPSADDMLHRLGVSRVEAALIAVL